MRTKKRRPVSLQFYRAVVDQVTPTTAIVTFPDYGNKEEVYLSDIRPVPKQAWVSLHRAQVNAKKGTGKYDGGEAETRW